MAGLGHNDMETAEMLFAYAEEQHPELVFEVRELLRLDVIQNLPNYKPEWLQWRTKINYETVTAFWRDEERVRKYIPGYSFKNWRALHKKYALEEFLYDPWKMEKTPVFVLADYAEKVLTRIKRSAIITKSSKDAEP